MSKYAMGFLAAAGFAIFAFAMSPTTASAGKDCARTKFETKMVADACKKGGQAEAKKAMKKFLKDVKKQDSKANCKTCHTGLAPDYDLKKDALELFKKYGGK